MTLPDKFSKWLEQAKAYYITYDNTMLDYEWDMLGRELSEKWDEWEHPYKHLVTPNTMHTAYYIKEEEYP